MSVISATYLSPFATNRRLFSSPLTEEDNVFRIRYWILN